LTPVGKDSKVKYNIIKDFADTTILVSGTDGGIYLINTTEANDLSAPWWCLGPDRNIASVDTFGRLLSFRETGPSGSPYITIEMSVHDPEKMPQGHHAAYVS
jgi:hypothetical protein